MVQFLPIISMSLNFVNRNDELYSYAKNILELDGFDTIICHGTDKCLYLYTNEEEEIEYKPEEFAELIKKSSSYTGQNIRLIACNTGALDCGVAQRLADVLGVSVLAPTEAVWVNSYGNLFITDYDVLANMWYCGMKVNQTGTWRLFSPKKGEMV